MPRGFAIDPAERLAPPPKSMGDYFTTSSSSDGATLAANVQRTRDLLMHGLPRGWEVVLKTPTSWIVSPGGSGMQNYLNLRTVSKKMNACITLAWNWLLNMWRQTPRLQASLRRRQPPRHDCLMRTVRIMIDQRSKLDVDCNSSAPCIQGTPVASDTGSQPDGDIASWPTTPPVENPTAGF